MKKVQSALFSRQSAALPLKITVLLTMICCFGALGGQSGVVLRKETGKLRVEVGGQLFTEYHFENTPRPFFYPVLGPGGTPMTRDWPMKDAPHEEKDHKHHRSLWFGHGSVNGVDFWSEEKNFGKVVHQRFLEVKSGPKFGVIRSKNLWINAEDRPVCSDERTLRFFSSDSPRIMDFDITIKASHGEVVLGDTKEGSMSIRLGETLRLKPNSFNRDKPSGRIVLSTGIYNGETWGKRAAWCDYSGQIDGQTVGVAIFDHPQNPRHPTWWHVRDYGLFAANPFGVHDFEKKPPGAGNLVIPSGKSITLRYRFIFHLGDEKDASIATLYENY